ncbi:hypothetical protein J2790_000932 [Paenarthrobacter nicotinovorans]|uniref:hypothetical protein n=1 Tax=Micrococcaceae TaxID=1268 RepID=UPI0004790A19|nr:MULTISPECIES: hypothetical protein [Micrococcaceae]MDR6435811.1 hypothetical protein [Paenarthrobacter nicotinovorans]BCW59457.1 hypothetical protein StoSoilB20_28040 [Arthrobacter sp. StoSoilB20]SCZ50793.1 hypothetical protein SAMN02799638_00671 [Arthrobacter sp. UNCCL28]
MRWDSLFDDLDAQFSAGHALSAESEITERSRVELAGIELGDRLRGAAGSVITLLLADDTVLEGVVRRVGGDWLVVAEGSKQWLVPFAAVLTFRGLGRLALKPASTILGLPGIASVLRALAMDRSELVLHLVAPAGTAVKIRGVIDRVGRDHLDIAVVRDGEARRAGNVASVMTVPFGAVAALCSYPGW